MTMNEPEAATAVEVGRAIGPIGTVGRLLLGVVFLAGAAFARTNGRLQWNELALGIVAAPLVLLGWQVVRLRWTTEQMDATGRSASP